MKKLLIILTFLLISACSTPSNKGRRLETGADLSRSTSQPTESIFPHPANFKIGSIHGKAVFNPASLEACLLCHSEEKAKGKLPTCYGAGCHDKSSVHTKAEFSIPYKHSVYAIPALKGENNCKDCHGEKLEGGKSGIACFSTNCHKPGSDFYHLRSNFSDYKVHEIAAQSTGNCGQCHDEYITVQKTKEECSKCHLKGKLHSITEYQKPQVHTQAALYDDGMEECLTCHTASGEDTLSCTKKCHDGYQHETSQIHRSDEFEPADQHGIMAVKEFSKDPKEPYPCTKCHGDNLLGQGFAKTCYKTDCHNPSAEGYGFYHFQANFAEGKVHERATIDRGKEECAQCHGNKIKLKLVEEECKQCHKDGAMHTLQEYFKADKHGKDVLESNQKLKSCLKSDCHSLREDDKLSCFKECHDGNKHTPSQIHLTEEYKPESEHGIEAVKAKLKEGKAKEPYPCTQCHGNDEYGGKSKISCFKNNCHTFEERYTYIQQFYHFRPNFKDGKVHELVTIDKGKEKCNKCHADRIKVRKTKEECVTCHRRDEMHTLQQYFLPEKHGADAFKDQPNKSITETCITEGCHNLKKDNNKLSCYKRCHKIEGKHANFKQHDETQVHIAEQYKKETEHGIVAARLKLRKEFSYNCTKCHGDDHRGGKSKRSCFDEKNCHKEKFGIYHYRPDFKAKDVHGPLAREIKYRKVCYKCHGNLLDGGKAKFSCFDNDVCHENERHDPSYGFPHTGNNFEKAEGHGKLALAKTYEKCFTCHDEAESKNRDTKTSSCWVVCHDDTTGKDFQHTLTDVHTKEYLTQKTGDEGTFVANHKAIRIFKDTGKILDPYATDESSFSLEKDRSVIEPRIPFYQGYCGKCHGTDFEGGKSKKSCFYTTAGTECHTDTDKMSNEIRFPPRDMLLDEYEQFKESQK